MLHWTDVLSVSIQNNSYQGKLTIYFGYFLFEVIILGY